MEIAIRGYLNICCGNSENKDKRLIWEALMRYKYSVNVHLPQGTRKTEQAECPILPRKLTFTIIMLLFLLPAYKAPAETVNRFAVYAARGEKFSIIYEGQARVYRPEPIPSGGISIQRKDQIQTKEGTVELRSFPSGLTVLIGDNSAVVFESAGDNSDNQVITLVYGRIRIINEMGRQTVTVRAGRSLVEAQHGDINIDYAVYPWIEGRADRTLVVSTLKNGAIVTVPPSAAERAALEQGSSKKKNIQVVDMRVPSKRIRVSMDDHQILMNEKESLYIDPILSVVEKRSLYEGIEPFWIERGYGPQESLANVYNAGYSPIMGEIQMAAKQPAPAPVQSQTRPNITGQPLTSQNAAPSLLPAEEKPPKKKSKAGLRVLGIVTGSILMAGGAGMMAFPYIAPGTLPDKNTENTVFVGGFIPLGLGLITIVGSILQ